VSFTVKHELVKKDGKIRLRKFSSQGREHFNICLFIEGPIDEVEYVEYELHPTFHNANRVVHKRAGGFPLTIWTWGEFDIIVTIHPKRGEREQIIYELKFGNQLPDSNSAYIDETPSQMVMS